MAYMSNGTSTPFIVRDHTFHGQHIREYPGALAQDQEDALEIAAKSYTPREVDTGAQKGDVTVIGFHANAFTKEVYEPLFEALYHELKRKHNLTISSIWIADQASQGTSAILNDERLGNDPHWFDHSRDVLQMVNTFRPQMRRPLVALGHSMGGTQAVATAHFHPRLFEAIVLLDPAMTMKVASTLGAMVKFARSRPDKFRTREELESFLRRHPFYKGWDPRVLDRHIDAGHHEKPTRLSPDSLVKPTTSPTMEIRGLMRPNPEHVIVAREANEAQRYTHPDISPDSPFTGPFYNPHTRDAYSMLPSLRPPTLFVLGKGSKICPADEIEHRTKVTGTSPGGSGGVAQGSVRAVTVRGGHFLPMTNVEGSAEAAAEWIAERTEKWRALEREFQSRWDKDAPRPEQKQQPVPVVREMLQRWDGRLWPNPHQASDGGRSKL